MLNSCRAFLRWRKRHAALRWGDIKFVDVSEPVLAFTRCSGESRVFAAFNLSSQPLEVVVQLPRPMQQIESVGVLAGELVGDRLRLPAHGVIFASS